MSRPSECSFCMTPVLLQTLEQANRELAKLRIKNEELSAEAKAHADRRYDVEAQLAELLTYRAAKPQPDQHNESE